MIFHITWKENKCNFYSTGANFEGETAREAFDLWEELFPNMFFFGMYIQEQDVFQFHKKTV